MHAVASEHGLRVFVHPPVDAEPIGTNAEPTGWLTRRPAPEPAPPMTARYLTADRGPYDTRRAVLKVSNEIVPTTLDMTAYDDVATVPRARAEALALEAKATLESRLGLEFCRVNPAKFL